MGIFVVRRGYLVGRFVLASLSTASSKLSGEERMPRSLLLLRELKAGSLSTEPPGCEVVFSHYCTMPGARILVSIFGKYKFDEIRSLKY